MPANEFSARSLSVHFVSFFRLVTAPSISVIRLSFICFYYSLCSSTFFGRFSFVFSFVFCSAFFYSNYYDGCMEKGIGCCVECWQWHELLFYVCNCPLPLAHVVLPSSLNCVQRLFLFCFCFNFHQSPSIFKWPPYKIYGHSVFYLNPLMNSMGSFTFWFYMFDLSLDTFHPTNSCWLFFRFLPVRPQELFVEKALVKRTKQNCPIIRRLRFSDWRSTGKCRKKNHSKYNKKPYKTM